MMDSVVEKRQALLKENKVKTRGGIKSNIFELEVTEKRGYRIQAIDISKTNSSYNKNICKL